MCGVVSHVDVAGSKSASLAWPATDKPLETNQISGDWWQVGQCPFDDVIWHGFHAVGVGGCGLPRQQRRHEFQ
jgi:hypothetical protein